MELSRYDQATVGLWGRGYAQAFGHIRQRALAEAAVHAVLVSLRRHDLPGLFRCYDGGTAADLALAGSLMPPDTPEETLWQLRDAAFYLRWLQLTGKLP